MSLKYEPASEPLQISAIISHENMTGFGFRISGFGFQGAGTWGFLLFFFITLKPRVE